ncbi:unnamed protein product [Amoebophrya sp. A25]|nr:unnamed protein product [Amoebophrya sp. A25]|eukprot:GSA25T00015789001.1
MLLEHLLCRIGSVDYHVGCKPEAQWKMSTNSTQESQEAPAEAAEKNDRADESAEASLLAALTLLELNRATFVDGDCIFGLRHSQECLLRLMEALFVTHENARPSPSPSVVGGETSTWQTYNQTRHLRRIVACSSRELQRAKKAHERFLYEKKRMTCSSKQESQPEGAKEIVKAPQPGEIKISIDDYVNEQAEYGFLDGKQDTIEIAAVIAAGGADNTAIISGGTSQIRGSGEATNETRPQEDDVPGQEKQKKDGDAAPDHGDSYCDAAPRVSFTLLEILKTWNSQPPFMRRFTERRSRIATTLDSLCADVVRETATFLVLEEATSHSNKREPDSVPPGPLPADTTNTPTAEFVHERSIRFRIDKIQASLETLLAQSLPNLAWQSFQKLFHVFRASLQSVILARRCVVFSDEVDVDVAIDFSSLVRHWVGEATRDHYAAKKTWINLVQHHENDGSTIGKNVLIPYDEEGTTDRGREEYQKIEQLPSWKPWHPPTQVASQDANTNKSKLLQVEKNDFRTSLLSDFMQKIF